MKNPITTVIYRPSWQKLRCSTLVEHNPYGGLLTVQGAEDAVNRMNNYISDAHPSNTKAPSYVIEEITRMGSTLAEEYACRVYRVNTFLQATINGVRQQQSGLTHIADVDAYNNALQSELSLSAVQRVANTWNWEVIQFEVESLWREDRMWFTIIYKDMEERLVEKDKTAPAMLKFIGIMNRVNSIGR